MTTAARRRITPERPPHPWPARLAVALLCGGSIAALLADLYGVAPMHAVFWLVSVPAMAVLALLPALPGVGADLRARIRVGAVAGALGTLGYDLARIPFALAGLRVFAPVETYGILVADASASSALTTTLGWLYHLSNGVTFGIAYAVLAARRPWPWGVGWGLLLETVAILGPFATRYGLSGHPVPIVIAYGAHVCYGWPVGRLAQNLDATDAALRRMGRHSVAVILVLAVAAVVLWHRPWQVSAPERAAAALSRGGPPVTVVRVDRFRPEWLRIRTGGCVLVDNRSARSYATPAGTVPARARGTLCFDRPGVYRIRLGTHPYSGGFVYVDAG
ncbi:hypothetical protein ACTOB_002782 [Actinoplanes oblitus]|uniref:Integral membrane protein n=1 Tax=Actinoplanes oblitus TaxID=3040509 RepID=A0ABY8WMN2_9ACTN|nr:hypothetical protein [Actinoplanes oblitus]WIM99141.1 hypothetical protein ACTOB_002782 [Actinoplanes oblitus]